MAPLRPARAEAGPVRGGFTIIRPKSIGEGGPLTRLRRRDIIPGRREKSHDDASLDRFFDRGPQRRDRGRFELGRPGVGLRPRPEPARLVARGPLRAFIHWGPVALKGTEISWSRANTNPLCPNKGEVPAEVYDNLYKSFDPVRFDADRWAAIAKEAGMRYVVLTAKHCDGFCLWPTATIDYNISRTPFRRDVCGELAEAVRKAGLRIGWYYSPMDWWDPDCRTAKNAAYVNRMQGQVRELVTTLGRIDIMWFDWD